MRDIYTIQRVEQLHPQLRKEAIEAIQEVEGGWDKGVAIRLTQVLRTIEEQNKLFAQGRTSKGNIVTNAKGGQSFHNYGLACDIVLIVDGKADWSITADRNNSGISDWEEVIRAFEKRGWFSGKNFKSFKDYPHLEKTFGLSWQQCFARYRDGDVFKLGRYEYINI